MRAQDKEAHRRQLREGLGFWQMGKIGERERGNRELLLPGEMEGGSAGDEYAEARTGGEQGSQLRRRLEQVLEVVQQQQQMPVAQCGAHLFLHGKLSGFPQAERLGDRCHDPHGIAHRGERHEAGPIGEIVQQRLRHRQPQACFAHTTGPREGQQAHLGTAQERAGRCQLVLAPDQRGEWCGQVISGSPPRLVGFPHREDIEFVLHG